MSELTIETPSKQSSTYQPIYTAPPARWFIADLPEMLALKQYREIELRFQLANDQSRLDMRHEYKYIDGVRNDSYWVVSKGPTGLASLKEWQQACPESAYAWLFESIYWAYWAGEHRTEYSSDMVSPAMWQAAQICADRCYIAGLKAIALDPMLWHALNLIGETVARYGTPDWLQTLIVTGELQLNTIDYAYLNDPVFTAEIEALLLKSGPELNETVTASKIRPQILPTDDPAEDPANLDYWFLASLSIYPTQFHIFRTWINYLLPRWGGSHEQIRELIASVECRHLNDIQRDRLLHEIWRDDYRYSYADESTDGASFRSWLNTTKKRLKEALFDYHRHECAMWIVHSQINRKNEEYALPYAEIATQEYLLDDEEHLLALLVLTLKFPTQTNWWPDVVIKSAQGFHTRGARLLYALYCEFGLAGFAQDRVIAEQWYADLEFDHNFAEVWENIVTAYLDAEHYEIVLRLAQRAFNQGHKKASFFLAFLCSDGLGCDKDPLKAIEYYQLLMDGPGYGAAANCYLLANDQCVLAKNKTDLAFWERILLDCAYKAIELGDEDMLRGLYTSCAYLKTPEIIQNELPKLLSDAEAGYTLAQAALAFIYGKKQNKAFYNYREGVLWLLAAEASDPNEELVQRARTDIYDTGFFASLKLGYTINKIEPHEIPGSDNRLV